MSVSRRTRLLAAVASLTTVLTPAAVGLSALPASATNVSMHSGQRIVCPT